MTIFGLLKLLSLLAKGNMASMQTLIFSEKIILLKMHTLLLKVVLKGTFLYLGLNIINERSHIYSRLKSNAIPNILRPSVLDEHDYFQMDHKV